MLERFSEENLLGYIEGDLDRKRAKKLDAALTSDPKAKELLDRMRGDRELLRSAVEPDLPLDFFTELEPQLSRPMLTGARPGTYRRRNRRRDRRSRFARMALAASVLLALSAAILATLSMLPDWFGGMDSEQLAKQDSLGAGTTASSDDQDALDRSFGAPAVVVQIDESDWPPADTLIHHFGPLSAPDEPILAGADAQSAPAPPATETDQLLIPAEFALVMRVADTQLAELTLHRLVAELAGDEETDPPASLVRNFSFAEAREMAARLRSTTPRGRRTPDRYTSVEDGEPGAMIPRDIRSNQDAARMLRSLRDNQTNEDQSLIGRQLAGSEQLAPSYRQQLEFSDSGATHTITIPASRLAEALFRLCDDQGQTTALRALTPGPDVGPQPEPSETDNSESSMLRHWMEDLAMIRRFAARLDRDHPDGFVLLPVMIDEQ